MNEFTPKYDLILILNYFRTLTYYLPLIEHLRDEFRIGIYPIPLHESEAKKHQSTQREFMRECVNRGAEIIERGPARAAVTLFPQDVYSDEAVQLIHENIISDRKVASLTLARPGIIDAFIEAFDPSVVFVVHKAFFDFLLRQRGDPAVYEGRELIEVGLPYRKYPPFPEFEADYFIAMPTPFSFPREEDKWDFLETIFDLIQQIPRQDRIVHKAHNALENDYFSGKKLRYIARFLNLDPTGCLRKIVKKLTALDSSGTNGRVSRLYTAMLYEKLMKRVVPMHEMTPHANLAFEAFLLGVKKGVIGGLSNTIWGTLFFELPFYNCVDMERQKREAGETLYKKDATRLLELNLQFFNVPFCEGKLEFDRKFFDIVDESTRQGDLFNELRTLIQQT